jgi:hypothetical protein
MSRRQVKVWMISCGWCRREAGPIFSQYTPALPSDWAEIPRSGHPAVPESMSTLLCPDCKVKAREMGRLEEASANA